MTDIVYAEGNNFAIVGSLPHALLLAAGQQGIPGPKGDKGDPGDVGGSLPWNNITSKPNLSYVHDFADSRQININHNMQKYPAVRVIDSAGNEWYPKQITYSNSNNVQIVFELFFSGQVFLS